MVKGRQTGTKKKRRGTRSWRLEAWRKDPHCHYCRVRIANAAEATTDHKQPLSDGGYSKRRNYVLACRACNKAKGSKPYDKFTANL